MDIVFNLRGHTYYIDTAVVAQFSSNPGLISAASARTSHMAKREEKEQFNRYPRINLVPSLLETADDLATTHKSSSNTYTAIRTTTPTAIRDAWAATLTTLQSCISIQQLRVVTTRLQAPVPHHPTRVLPWPSPQHRSSLHTLVPDPPSPHGRPLPVAAVNTQPQGRRRRSAPSEASRLCSPII